MRFLARGRSDDISGREATRSSTGDFAVDGVLAGPCRELAHGRWRHDFGADNGDLEVRNLRGRNLGAVHLMRRESALLDLMFNDVQMDNQLTLVMRHWRFLCK